MSAQWLHWNFYEEEDSQKEKQFADIFTKAFTKPAEWARVVTNVGLRTLKQFRARAGGA